MTELVKAVLAVGRADTANTQLVSKEPLNALNIAVGYPIAKWSGRPASKELWQRLLLMQTKSPHRVVFPEGEDFYDVEYRHRGETAEGLGAAHLMDGLGVSLPVEPCWDADQVQVERERLVEDVDGAEPLETDEVGVRHLSSSTHCETHGSWIRQSVEAFRAGGLGAVRRGEELWEHRAEYFPELQFLPRVEQDLRQLPDVWVRPVRDRLVELQQAVAEWDPQASPIAPQWRSYVRTEFEMRRRLCWFTDDDGTQQLFDWHCEFLPKPGRMHFRLLHDQRTLRIAYVGRKLGV
ncbi:hypothetical protein [Streptomyces sp. NPDC054784]